MAAPEGNWLQGTRSGYGSCELLTPHPCELLRGCKLVKDMCDIIDGCLLQTAQRQRRAGERPSLD